eukprot:TRINITY_DN19302_c0_g1_i2.p1 TRINITY_DN19302_c0_g1~~TRINITY_DN19302_c0_g1_i2.p1  ORF type:complete len:293 (-),score=58.36 TRINITY_DN19302_c0_g1_i2:94-972(-)
MELNERETLVELLPPEYTRSATLVPFHAAVVPKALGGGLLKLLQQCAALGPEHLHLKRVRSGPAASGGTPGCLQVLISPATSTPPQEVVSFLEGNGCDPCTLVEVPRDGALTRAQFAEFSQHWPLTFRKPSFEPLELTEAQRSKYLSLLRRAFDSLGAEENGRKDRCACVIVDKNGRELARATDESDAHPLRHSVMVAIEKVAESARKVDAEGVPEAKRARTDEDYLCQDCEVVTTHEPCVMCAMALVHSRVRLVAYRASDEAFGGLGGCFSLHACPSLNHQLRVLRWCVPE